MSSDTWCEVHRTHHPDRGVPWTCKAPPPVEPIGPSELTEVVSTAGWVPVDDHAPVDDVAVLAQARAAAAELFLALVPDGPVARALRTSQEWGDDVLRAVAYDPAGVQPMWCREHDRDTRECGADAPCDGFPYHPGRDPAGEVAVAHVVGRSEFLVDRDGMIGRLRRLPQLARALSRVAEVYDTHTGAATPEVNLDWCSSCQRDAGYCSPVDRLNDGKGTPRYRDKITGGLLCWWCGQFKASHGGKLPPVSILRARHEGRRITEAMIAAAFRAEKAAKR